jgi:hypothetical protein
MAIRRIQMNMLQDNRFMSPKLNAELQAKKYELEYVQHEINRLYEDLLSLKGEIYEIEQIQSSNT